MIFDNVHDTFTIEECGEDFKRSNSNYKNGAKEVICISTGQRFESTMHVSRAIGLGNSMISQACRKIYGHSYAGYVKNGRVVKNNNPDKTLPRAEWKYA